MNYMIYCKAPGARQFGAMDLHKNNVGVGLVYATLVTDKERAIGYANELAKLNPGCHFQARVAGKSTVVHKAYVPQTGQAEESAAS